MPKFFIPEEKITDTTITIDTEDVTHITRVLRLGAGDRITLCDSRGYDYDAVIEEINKGSVLCRIEEKRKSDSEPNIKVTLFQGIPKGSKPEYIIQKTTELGISCIVPVRMARCVAKIEKGKDEKKKTERWQKIAEAAAKQSGRGIIPKIAPVMDFEDVIKAAVEFDLFFAPYECEEEKTLKEVLTGKKDIKTVGYLIGPEGGYDLKETQKLKESGIETVTLGRRILRTETAGEAVLAMMMYEIGDVNIK